MSTKYTDAEIRRMIQDYLFQEMMVHPDPIAHPYEYQQCRNWADEVVDNGHYSVIERYGPESPGWSGDVFTKISVPQDYSPNATVKRYCHTIRCRVEETQTGLDGLYLLFARRWFW